MEAVARKYQAKAEFLFIYCREAHPDGDPKVKTRTKKNQPIKQAQTIAERKAMAQQFCADMKLARRILVDEFEQGGVQRQYGGRANPTVVVDLDGAIALKMAWTHGQNLDRFLGPFLAGGGKFDAKLAASVPAGDGKGGPGTQMLARLIDKMLEGLVLTEAETKITRDILTQKMQCRGRLRLEAQALEDLARDKKISDADLARATKDFETKVADLQRKVADWDRTLRGQVSGRARAQLLATGILENGLGLGPRGPGPGSKGPAKKTPRDKVKQPSDP